MSNGGLKQSESKKKQIVLYPCILVVAFIADGACCRAWLQYMQRGGTAGGGSPSGDSFEVFHVKRVLAQSGATGENYFEFHSHAKV
jgi:hypothetical protein